MASSVREAKESPLELGQDEQLPYRLSTTPWGGSPTVVSVFLWNITTGSQVSAASLLSGSPSVSGDYITAPLIVGAIAGQTYRLEFRFTSGGAVWEPYAIIRAEE